MITFIIVPFLLVFELLLYYTRNDMYMDTFVAVNTFDVFVKSTFVPDWSDFDTHKTDKNLLSLQLTCYVTYYDRMLCRTEKYKKMILQSSSNFSSMIEEDFEHSSSKLTDRRIRHDSFDQPGTPFEVQFDHSGVISYIVEKKDTESMKMNNVYRMIANLMSVGAYGINYESDSFSVMELSTVGYCSTNYTIARYSSSKKKILSKKLSPYFAQHFNESETMLISKHRDIDTCTELSHYSFAARFWHQFVPALSITEDIRKSESFITLNDDTLKSVTENSFDFLDEEGDRIGSVVETATLKLTSVDMKSIYGQFNSNTNYILDIVNDDEI